MRFIAGPLALAIAAVVAPSCLGSGEARDESTVRRLSPDP